MRGEALARQVEIEAAVDHFLQAEEYDPSLDFAHECLGRRPAVTHHLVVGIAGEITLMTATRVFHQVIRIMVTNDGRHSWYT